MDQNTVTALKVFSKMIMCRDDDDEEVYDLTPCLDLPSRGHRQRQRCESTGGPKFNLVLPNAYTESIEILNEEPTNGHGSTQIDRRSAMLLASRQAAAARSTSDLAAAAPSASAFPSSACGKAPLSSAAMRLARTLSDIDSLGQRRIPQQGSPHSFSSRVAPEPLGRSYSIQSLPASTSSPSVPAANGATAQGSVPPQISLAMAARGAVASGCGDLRSAVQLGASSTSPSIASMNGGAERHSFSLSKSNAPAHGQQRFSTAAGVLSPRGVAPTSPRGAKDAPAPPTSTPSLFWRQPSFTSFPPQPVTAHAGMVRSPSQDLYPPAGAAPSSPRMSPRPPQPSPFWKPPATSLVAPASPLHSPRPPHPVESVSTQLSPAQARALMSMSAGFQTGPNTGDDVIRFQSSPSSPGNTQAVKVARRSRSGNVFWEPPPEAAQIICAESQRIPSFGRAGLRPLGPLHQGAWAAAVHGAAGA